MRKRSDPKKHDVTIATISSCFYLIHDMHRARPSFCNNRPGITAISVLCVDVTLPYSDYKTSLPLILPHRNGAVYILVYIFLPDKAIAKCRVVCTSSALVVGKNRCYLHHCTLATHSWRPQRYGVYSLTNQRSDPIVTSVY